MTFPIERVRHHFPSLSILDGGRPRVYLDNPAGTQVTQGVVDAVSRCFLEANANLGGRFKTSHLAEEVVRGAHQAMAYFLGTSDPGEVVVGSSMTALTFHLSRSICHDFSAGDEVIVTRMDHEGNVAPWMQLAQDQGLVLKFADFDRQTWRLDPEKVASLIGPKTRLMAFNYASNMTGAVNEVRTIAAEARRRGCLTYVDAVQSAPHLLTDVRELGCDFLVCSSYKFFGPHLGVLWGRRELWEKIHAYKCRCSDESLPSRFEVGTPAIELLAGLRACVEHFQWLGKSEGGAGEPRADIVRGLSELQAYERGLAGRLLDGLGAIEGLQRVGPPLESDRPRAPTVSVRHHRVQPRVLADALGRENIFVWHGHNYAYETARALGIEEEGVLRIGLAHYNTEAEVDQVVDAVARACA